MYDSTALVHYERWSKKELYRVAKAVGICGRSSMTKGELVHELKQHCPVMFARWQPYFSAYNQLQMAW